MRSIVEQILAKRQVTPLERSLLVGISGIDASGKGFITAQLAEMLSSINIKVAAINVDGWLNLPHVRFSRINAGKRFYEQALRFAEMFGQLILPLKENRSISLTADYAEETANRFRKHEYIYQNIDVILLEGIFLFKKSFCTYYDLKIWVECPFQTALERAVRRSQEGLTPEETIRAYETIYFPAQKFHFSNDQPLDAADIIINNDNC